MMTHIARKGRFFPVQGISYVLTTDIPVEVHELCGEVGEYYAVFSGHGSVSGVRSSDSATSSEHAIDSLLGKAVADALCCGAAISFARRS